MRLLISDLQRWNGLYDKIIQAHDLLLENYGRHTVITILSGRKDDEVRYLKYEQRIVNYAKDLWRSSTIGDEFQKVFTAWKLSSLQCVPFSPALLMQQSFRNLEDGKKLEFFTELRALLIHTEISRDVAHRADITFPKREGINTARLNSRKLLKKFIARSSAADSEAKARDSATELSDCDGDGGGSGGKEEVAPGADADAAPPSTKKLRSDCEPFPQFPLVMSAASCAAVSPTDSPASAEEEKEDEVNELKKQLAEAGPHVQALVKELKKQLAEARHQVQILSAPAELQDLKGTAHDAAAAEPASESVNMDVSLVAEMMVELSNVPSLDVQASAAAGGTGMSEVINTARLNSRKLLKKYIDSEAKARDSATELSDCDGDSGGSGGKEEGEVNKLKKQLAEARGQVQALSAQVQLLSAELQELKGTARDAAAEMCTMRGIRNPSSSQNCFLNTCLQAFWQIRLFRDGLLNLPTHRHDSRADENACLQCALFDFIYAYKFGKTAPLDPSRVRHALALRSKSRFAERQTADAYEALTALLEALHSAAQGRIRDDAPIMEPCLPLCLVHEIFWFVFLCPPPPTRSHARITFVSLCVL